MEKNESNHEGAEEIDYEAVGSLHHLAKILNSFDCGEECKKENPDGENFEQQAEKCSQLVFFQLVINSIFEFKNY